MKRTLLIDGDVVAYKSAAVVEKGFDWGDGLWTLHADEKEAIARLEADIDDMLEKLEATDAEIALTDSEGNWRKTVYPAYKSNRKAVRKPLVLRAMRQYLMDNFETRLRPTLEGDDIMGILATHSTLVQGEKIIVSIDKDMKTIPGLIYNPGREEEGIVSITREQADRWHMFQTLTGDTTDGYPGCPSIGPKKADDILSKCEAEGVPFWPAIVATYERCGLTEADALAQARVARICRAEDYDFKRKKVKLWNPPK